MKRILMFAAAFAALAVTVQAAPKAPPAPAAPAAPAGAPGAADWRTPDPNDVLVIDTNRADPRGDDSRDRPAA